MNGQKINRYSFIANSDGFSIQTGKELKGQTLYSLSTDSTQDWEATFEGGLDNLFSNLNGSIKLNFYKFPEQGIKMLIELGSEDFVFQASIIGE